MIVNLNHNGDYENFPEIAYTGYYQFTDEGNGNWNIRFSTGGNMTFSELGQSSKFDFEALTNSNAKLATANGVVLSKNDKLIISVGPSKPGSISAAGVARSIEGPMPETIVMSSVGRYSPGDPGYVIMRNARE